MDWRAMNLTNQDKELIDQQFSELSRSWGPSGIYLKVQAFISDGLEQARARHREDCALKDGWRGCSCGRPVEALLGDVG